MTHISSFENERLNTILKSFNDQKIAIKSYSDFNEKIRTEKQQQEKDNIFERTKQKLNSLADKISSEIQELVDKIAELKAPNLAKSIDNSGSLTSIEITNQKIYGATEYGNALKVVELKPDNIHEILKEAIEHKRYEFFFTVSKLIMAAPNINKIYKNKVERIYETLKELIGLTELEDKKRKLDSDLVEVKEYLAMDYATFESRVHRTIRVAKRMKETGQLEAESILTN